MNRYVVSADVVLCLMMMQEDGDYLPSDSMTYSYFLLVPETFMVDLTESSTQLMYKVYQDHYQVFRIREPNDPNYIAVVNVIARTLTSAEFEAKPWLTARCPAWESSNCIVVDNDGFQKAEVENFAAVLGIE